MSGLKDVSFLSVKKPLKVKHEVKKVNHSEINYIWTRVTRLYFKSYT